MELIGLRKVIKWRKTTRVQPVWKGNYINQRELQ